MNKYQHKFLKDCAERTPIKPKGEWLVYIVFSLFMFALFMV